MNHAVTLGTSVGLRHLIEDAISVLSQERIEEERRKYVIADVTALLLGAVRGSELVENRSLFFNAEDRNAFEAFSFIDSHLGEKAIEWSENLKKSARAFDLLAKGRKVDPMANRAAKQLLIELLASLERQDSAGIPESPEDIVFDNPTS